MSKLFETKYEKSDPTDYDRFRPWSKAPAVVETTMVPEKREYFPMSLGQNGKRDPDAMDVDNIVRPRRGHGY